MVSIEETDDYAAEQEIRYFYRILRLITVVKRLDY
jgi:hypothetical protein